MELSKNISTVVQTRMPIQLAMGLFVLRSMHLDGRVCCRVYGQFARY